MQVLHGPHRNPRDVHSDLRGPFGNLAVDIHQFAKQASHDIPDSAKPTLCRSVQLNTIASYVLHFRGVRGDLRRSLGE